MQSGRTEFDALIANLQKPLSENSPVPMLVVQAVLATRERERIRNKKPSLNVRTLDTNDLDRGLTSEFLQSLRSNSTAHQETVHLVVKDEFHYFVAVINFSEFGNQFAVLDAAGDPRGLNFTRKLLDVRAEDRAKYFFQKGFMASGTKHDGAQYDLHSWFPQKDGKSCLAFTADHVFKVSKMKNFFSDLEKHIDEKSSYGDDLDKPRLHNINWIYLAKKLVQRAQSKRWRKEYNRLHPEETEKKDILPVELHFEKIANEAVEMLVDMASENGSEAAVQEIKNLVGLTKEQAILINSLAAETLGDELKPRYASNFDAEKENVSAAEDAIALGQIMKTLSPADCRKIFTEFPEKKELIDGMFEYTTYLLADLNQAQKQAVCEGLLDRLTGMIDSNWGFGEVMRYCPDAMRQSVFDQFKFQTKDWIEGFDMIDFQETAKAFKVHELEEFCMINKDYLKNLVSDASSQQYLDKFSHDQLKIIQGLSLANPQNENKIRVSQQSATLFGSSNRGGEKSKQTPDFSDEFKPGNK